MTATTFDTITALEPVGASAFVADVHPEWTIGGKPNGGYLLSLLGRAAAQVGTHGHVIAASAHYLHAPEPGPAAIEVRTLRNGRTASQYGVHLRQNDRPCVEALVTTGRLATGTEPYWSAGVPNRARTDFASAVRLPGTNPSGVRVAIMDQVDLRLDRDSLGFASGRPAGRGELRGWLALPGGAAFDPTSLLYAVDAFPPATFDIELTGWVPTLELTVYVRALPAPGPVQVLQRAHLIDDQRVDEQCWVWDATGRVVAHGTQLAGIRLG
ncbi:thioesterase family protein [uncultured Jatrophihabitans sp.]|uniref:thioesterase family protein n=1 Tax=uncultured Jatrophihabitans sp. TaxID=1610747 RepID=UPI0035C98B8E